MLSYPKHEFKYNFRVFLFQALGSHKSQEEPPMLPIFRNKIAKKTQPAASSSTSTMVSELKTHTNSQNIRLGSPACNVIFDRLKRRDLTNSQLTNLK